GVVAVFRGVPGQVAGQRLTSQQERSATSHEELTTTAQDAVKQGIPVSNVAEARRKLSQLTSDDPTNSNKLPACQPRPSAEPSAASQGPTPVPSTTPAAASSSSSPDTTQTPLPTISCRTR
ncbi:MAG: protein serine/threonine phosphatase, partial [Dactylosporangium sp.]|nr:protein serine/threonine phosphatase [Dactylosporangium sp.]